MYSATGQEAAVKRNLYAGFPLTVTSALGRSEAASSGRNCSKCLKTTAAYVAVPFVDTLADGIVGPVHRKGSFPL